MRPVFALSLFLFGAATAIWAQTPREPTLPQRYLEVYLKLHDAEDLEKKQDYAGSLKAFQDCYRAYDAIHQADPDWETALVGHRMDDCKVTIQRLQNEIATAQLPPDTAHPTKANSTNDSVTRTAPPPAPKNQYVWHTGILADLFYLGGDSAGNVWGLPLASGSDNPDDRNGYASGTHASYFNPFYVALPFNDLTNPDKAKQYLPAGWQRPPLDGKPVSACQGRWVGIKAEDGTGHMCYAQWEDVGPLRADHAEYVFGSERPDTGNRAGISISPAVMEYLGLKDTAPEKRVIRWHFVDDRDVPPGIWLKLEEQAVIYTAMHQVKDIDAGSPMDTKK